MKFKLPTLADLDETGLKSSLDEALAEYKELSKIADADLTDENLESLEALADAVSQINSETETRAAAAKDRADRAAAARAALDAASAEPETPADEDKPADDAASTDDEKPVDTTDEEVAKVTIPDDASSIVDAAPSTTSVETEDLVTASVVGVKRPVVDKVAPTQPVDTVETVSPKTPASIVAAAGAPGFSAGDKIEDLDQVVEALSARFGSFPSSNMGSSRVERFGVVKLQKGLDGINAGFSQSNKDFRTDLELVDAVINESRLPGGSLVAAGGWCAPSETIYDLCALETVSGILSVPEIDIKRGGINFTKGPDFEAIYNSIGFLQTEAQAEAGTVKNIIDVECPDFDEVRMDAIGYGIKAGILTNAAYPELIRRYLEGGIVAHAHKVNASVIGRISTLLGTPVDFTELGSAAVDTLNAVSFIAERLRYRYRMDQNATMEAFAPHWLLEVIRADLAFKNGVESYSVSDAQIQAYFGARKINMQWVYDWQNLASNATDYPATANIAVYPAGTFVKGGTDVISLDAMYDSTDLETNTYTAVFFEEGLLVANTCGSGNMVTVSLAAHHGRSGAADITNLVTP